MRCTVHKDKPENPESSSVPTNRKLADGQYADHWVLCEEERAKGFIRPLRTNYVHVGIPGPKHPLRNLTDEEKLRVNEPTWVKFEEYPEGSKGSALGKYWTQKEIDSIGKGCGITTRMPRACAETYAREPGYYGSTFCCGCNAYFQVGKDGEFVWEGTDERVGT